MPQFFSQSDITIGAAKNTHTKPCGWGYKDKVLHVHLKILEEIYWCDFCDIMFARFEESACSGKFVVFIR